MIELTGDEIATTLVMEHQVDPRLVLVVEGPEDIQVLERHVRETVAYLMFAGSKSAVLEAARQLHDDHIDWAVFVVDADFDRKRGLIDSHSGNVVWSRSYDLMMDVLNQNPALIWAAISSQAAPGTAPALRDELSADLPAVARSLALPVGALRWLVVAGEFDLSVRGWSFRECVTHFKNGVWEREVGAQAERRSGGRVLADDIHRRITEVSTWNGEFTDLVCGHDTIAALAELVRYKSGTSIGHDALAGTIRAGVSCSAFLALPTVQSIEEWARELGAQVFSCEASAA